MVGYLKNTMYSRTGNEKKSYVEIACLSSDTKPINGIVTGSVCLEVDTGKIYAFNEAASEWVEQGGGGISPSTVTVETIEGTVADMFGDVDVATLITALNSMGASAYLTVDASALGMSTILSDLRYGLVAEGATLTSDSVMAYAAVWADDGTLSSFYMTTDGTTITDISPYASMITTVLTIVWHPLPTE